MNDENSGLIPVGEHELFQATTARGFEAGHVVFNRFVLRRVLGRGGMGIVWLAYDNQLEQEVAIKVLPDVVMHDREAVIDMKRETKRSLQLNHHNIVRIYDFNQDDKAAGISMEYVDGETLSSAKADRPQGCFDPEQVGPWLEQICEALAYAHARAKIVHRDLKPANIMLSKSDTIKVTDFGIARSISDSISRVSMRHASSGTMVYMSPQQSTGAKSSASDDIYALGATIYDLLTGRPPFYSGNIQHQLESITPPSMTDRRMELERHGAPIPEAWERAVAACLEKEVSKRPSSVRDLAQRLNLHVAARLPVPPPLVQPAPVTILEKALPTASAPVVPPLPKKRLLPPGLMTPARIKRLLPPGLMTPARIKHLATVGGIAGLVIVLCLVTMSVVGRGTLLVDTLPAGAMVSLGRKSLPSPATFDKVWGGRRTVTLQLPGYDPVSIAAQVTKNKVTDLGTISLTRSTGSIMVHSIPEHADCTLKLVQSPVAGEVENHGVTVSGTAPWNASSLVTGTYRLIVSADDYSEVTDTIQIQRGVTVPVNVDVVKENALRLLPPHEANAVSADQPLPSSMTHDPNSRDALTAYYQHTFQGYLKTNEFKRAAQQLERLSSDFGLLPKDQQKQIDQDEKVWLSQSAAKFNQLLEQNRFASAAAFLDDLDARSTKTGTAVMRDALAKAKTAHDQAIEKVLAAIDAQNSAGKSGEAYQMAVGAAAHDVEEPRLLQELATLELPQPSTYDRVSNRLKSMTALLALDSTLNQNAEFTRLLAIFQKNMDRHNDFRAKIDAAEQAANSYDSRIADLRAEQEHNRKKANGYKVLGLFGLAGSIAGAVENNGGGSAAGNGAAALGVGGQSAREADIRRLQGEIDEIVAERQPAQDQLAEIRREYEALKQTPIGNVP